MMSDVNNSGDEGVADDETLSWNFVGGGSASVGDAAGGDRVVYVKFYPRTLGPTNAAVDDKVSLPILANVDTVKNCIIDFISLKYPEVDAGGGLSSYRVEIEVTSSGDVYEWNNDFNLKYQLSDMTGGELADAPSSEFLIHVRHKSVVLSPADEDNLPEYQCDAPQLEALPSYREELSVNSAQASGEMNSQRGDGDSAYSGESDGERAALIGPSTNLEQNSPYGSSSSDDEEPIDQQVQSRYNLRSSAVHNSSVPSGITGLSNLGNTCYMNSALQCLSNTTELSAYFLSGKWKEDLNSKNPLGMKGMVAQAYADLIEHLWDGSSGRSSCFSPRYFKGTIGTFNSMFSGYGQQDSQELLGFLLDGLHEDLNRIKVKPYIEVPDMANEADEVCARKLWEIYCKRNDSVIVDLFQGQYRSRLECTICGQNSVTFDPYMFLSLPIPDRTVFRYSIFVVGNPYTITSKNGKIVHKSIRPVLLDVEGGKEMTFLEAGKQICEKLGWNTEPPPTTSKEASVFWTAEIYQNRVHKVYKGSDRMAQIAKNDEVYFFYVGISDGDSPFGHEDYAKDVWGKLLPTASSDTSLTLTSIPIFSVTGCDITTQQTSGFSRWNTTAGVLSVINVPVNLEKIVSEHVTEESKTPTLCSTSKKRTASTCKIDGPAMKSTYEPAEGVQVLQATLEGEEADYQFTTEPGDEQGEAERNIADSGEVESTFRLGEIESDIGEIIYSEIVKSLLSVLNDANSDIPDELLDDSGMKKNLFKIYYVSEISRPTPEVSRFSYYRYGENKDSFYMNDWCNGENSDAAAVGLVTKEESNPETSGFAGTNYKGPDQKTNLVLLYDADLSNDHTGADHSCSTCVSSDGEPRRKSKKINFEFSGRGVFVIEWDPDIFERLGPSGFAKSLFSYVYLSDTPFSTEDTIPGAFYKNPPTRNVGKSVVEKVSSIGLMDCINEFGKEETLGSDDTWYCPKCKEHIQARKKLDIWSVPDILVFHLKRFSNSRSNSLYTGRSFNDKIDSLVDAPVEGLDLSNIVVGNKKGVSSAHGCVYDLFAVSNHFGGLGGGHYTAYAKNTLDGCWYDFDDSRVSRVHGNIMSKNAYLLFYRRRKDNANTLQQQAEELSRLIMQRHQRDATKEHVAQDSHGLGGYSPMDSYPSNTALAPEIRRSFSSRSDSSTRNESGQKVDGDTFSSEDSTESLTPP